MSSPLKEYGALKYIIIASSKISSKLLYKFNNTACLGMKFSFLESFFAIFREFGPLTLTTDIEPIP